LVFIWKLINNFYVPVNEETAVYNHASFHFLLHNSWKKNHYTLVSHNRKYSELICLNLEWAEHTLTHLSKSAIGVFF